MLVIRKINKWNSNCTLFGVCFISKSQPKWIPLQHNGMYHSWDRARCAPCTKHIELDYLKAKISCDKPLVWKLSWTSDSSKLFIFSAQNYVLVLVTCDAIIIWNSLELTPWFPLTSVILKKILVKKWTALSKII